MLPAMNLGGTEKSLLNLLDTYSPEEKDVTILLTRKTGALLDEVPDWVTTREVTGFDRPRYELSISPFKIAFKYFVQLKIIRGCNILFKHIRFRLTKNRVPYYRYVFKGYSLEERYDTAVAYLGPYDPISAYILFCINAEKKVQWIHFDVSKFLFHKETCKELYPMFDQINVVSDDARASLVNIIPEIAYKTKTVMNVISPKKCKESAERGLGFTDGYSGIRILTVGRLSEEKGQDIIPEVAYGLKQKGLEFRWYIIGEGDLSNTIRQKIAEYQVKDNVVLLGQQKNPYPYYKKSNIYVLTSFFEAHCVTIEEAKIFDLPIVSTDCAGIHEQLAGHENSLIVERESQNIIDAIVSLVSILKTNGDIDDTKEN